MRYAHVAPTAFETDHGRLDFVVLTEKARIYDLQRDSEGRVVGRHAVRADSA